MFASAKPRRSILARALFVASLIGIAYPLFQAQSKEQTLLLDLGSHADSVRSLRLEWTQTNNPDLTGIIERNFTASPCPTPGAKPCLLVEHLRVPNGSYTLLTKLTYEPDPKAVPPTHATSADTDTTGVMLSGSPTKVFLSPEQ